tara:strand:+ start:310 stop:510 length:201 start_codon:yes stop_codon:yes gene_type:complete
MEEIRQKALNSKDIDFEDIAFKALLEGFCSHCNPNKETDNKCMHFNIVQSNYDKIIKSNNKCVNKK